MTDAKTFDRRPGEACIRSETKQLVATQESTDVRGRCHQFGLEAGVTYLFAARIGKAIVLDYSGVELVAAERGALPVTFPPQDGRQAREWLRGYALEPSFAERVEEAMATYDLPGRSLAECLVRLADAGFAETDAARLLLEVHARAIAEQQGRREPWVEWTSSLIASKDRLLARGVPHRMALATLGLTAKR